MSDEQFQDGELIFYRTDDGVAKVEVLYLGETFWLNQKRMAELFGVEVNTINYHLKEVFSSGELQADATIRKIRIVQSEGNRQVSREIEHYNLDAIIGLLERSSCLELIEELKQQNGYH